MKHMLFVILLAIASYVLLAVCPAVKVYVVQIVMAGLSGFLLMLAIVLAYILGNSKED